MEIRLAEQSAVEKNLMLTHYDAENRNQMPSRDENSVFKTEPLWGPKQEQRTIK